MRRSFRLVIWTITVVAGLYAVLPALVLAETPLIPRRVLFGNPDKTAARISPDGKQLGYLAPVDGVLNVFVGPVDSPGSAKAVTSEKKRNIRNYVWAFDNAHVLYSQDTAGDENWHIFSVDLATIQTKDLTPLPKVSAQIQDVSHKFPQEILVGLNDRNPQYHDTYRIHIVTGEKTLVQKNDEFASFTSDDDFRLRFAQKMTPDGATLVFQSDGAGGWKGFQKISFEDSTNTSLMDVSKDGKTLFMNDSRGRNTSAIVAIDLATERQSVVASNDRTDAGRTLRHPTEKNIQAVMFNYDKPQWQVLDPAIADDLKYLATVAAGEVQVGSRSLDDTKWIVDYAMDDGPDRTYLYDRKARKATFLFTSRQALEGLPLVKMHPVVVKSRDGLDLVCYLSLPKDAAPKDAAPGGALKTNAPVPLVLHVHGGPWGRDLWGYNRTHQWLANRGFAVLSVNYRGSTGFGKAFTNAGDKQWSGKVFNDLLDAVDWAIAQKIADPKRLVIMGGSWGGYSTLVGLTFAPEKFACGIDIVGPSNLVTLLNSIPSYWAPRLQRFKDRIGDPTTEEGRKILAAQSPLTFADKIQRPLLIGQGANDPRVKQAEADQIARALLAKKVPMTYILFPDEGHGFARPENNLAFNAVCEAFLAKQIPGTRAEPIGSDFAGSTIRCLEGAAEVPGLSDALKQAGR